MLKYFAKCNFYGFIGTILFFFSILHISIIGPIFYGINCIII